MWRRRWGRNKSVNYLNSVCSDFIDKRKAENDQELVKAGNINLLIKIFRYNHQQLLKLLGNSIFYNWYEIISFRMYPRVKTNPYPWVYDIKIGSGSMTSIKIPRVDFLFYHPNFCIFKRSKGLDIFLQLQKLGHRTRSKSQCVC